MKERWKLGQVPSHVVTGRTQGHSLHQMQRSWEGEGRGEEERRGMEIRDTWGGEGREGEGRGKIEGTERKERGGERRRGEGWRRDGWER